VRVDQARHDHVLGQADGRAREETVAGLGQRNTARMTPASTAIAWPSSSTPCGRIGRIQRGSIRVSICLDGLHFAHSAGGRRQTAAIVPRGARRRASR